MSFESKIKLTGADKFILALEKYNKLDGNSGNTCHYLLQLDGSINEDILRKKIAESKIVEWIGSLKLSGTNSNHWKVSQRQDPIIEEIKTDELFPKDVLNKAIDLSSSPLFCFHILQRSNGTSALLCSWHHLLMDGYGANLFLKALENESIANRSEKSNVTSNNLLNARKAKRYVTKSSKGDTARIALKQTTILKQSYKSIHFSKIEYNEIRDRAKKHGAKFGLGNYYLACASKAAQALIDSSDDYWVPIPQDTRKRGAKWPIVGNHLSFLFYRIPVHGNSLGSIIESLNDQMLLQIKEEIPQNYSQLMNYLKWLPSGPYSKLIKGKNRSNVASFLFTSAPDLSDSLNTIFGQKVIDAYNIPPNTYPPGLTFVVNHFQGELRFIILYYEHLFTSDQIDLVAGRLSAELLNSPS